ncbi:MAG TPA: hypothetical protein DIW44_06365 [Anaerolineaceae bacterium]|nr:hypothetical protein [Anaerolineaceae bacterium]
MKNIKMLPWLYLALGLAQAAHSVEEVLTGLWMNLPAVTGLLHDRLRFVPVLNWSAEGFAAANLVIVALLLGFSPFVFQRHAWALKIVRVVAVIEVLNAALHIIPAIVKGSYRSGCISAVFLLGTGLVILIKTGYSHELKSL